MPNQIEDYVKNHNAQLAYLVSLDVKHLAEKYAGAVNNWNTYITLVGKDPGYPAPTVPIGPGISAPDDQGMVHEVEDFGPVCDPLPTFPVPKLGAAPSDLPLIGKRLWPNQPYFQAGQLDSVPDGTEVMSVSADGVKGVFRKMATAMGGSSGGFGGHGAIPGVYLLEASA